MLETGRSRANWRTLEVEFVEVLERLFVNRFHRRCDAAASRSDQSLYPMTFDLLTTVIHSGPVLLTV